MGDYVERPIIISTCPSNYTRNTLCQCCCPHQQFHARYFPCLSLVSIFSFQRGTVAAYIQPSYGWETGKAQTVSLQCFMSSRRKFSTGDTNAGSRVRFLMRHMLYWFFYKFLNSALFVNNLSVRLFVPVQ